MDDQEKEIDLCIEMAVNMLEGIRTAVQKHDVAVGNGTISLAIAILVDSVRISLEQEPDEAAAMLIDALSSLVAKYEASGESSTLSIRKLEGAEAEFATASMAGNKARPN